MKSQTIFTRAILAALAGAGTTPHGLHQFNVPQFRGATPSRRVRKDKIGYGASLMRHFDKKRRNALPKVGVLRDTHGAITLIGRPSGYGQIDTSNLPQMGRRVWLAGISAQRGY